MPLFHGEDQLVSSSSLLGVLTHFGVVNLQLVEKIHFFPVLVKVELFVSGWKYAS